MLESYLGSETFQKSLACYIKKYACSNAKTEVLWEVLEVVSKESVKELMNSWTQQKGYPVVAVSLKDQKLKLKQSHFLLSDAPGDSQWIIPTSVCCGSYDNGSTFLLKEKSGSLDIKETGVLDDSFALCMSGQQSLTILKLGWEPKSGESNLDAMLRRELLTVLVYLGHENTFSEANRRFDAFCADRDSPLLPPDTNSLASCPDPDIVLEVLNFLLSPEVSLIYSLFFLNTSSVFFYVQHLQKMENFNYVQQMFSFFFLPIISFYLSLLHMIYSLSILFILTSKIYLRVRKTHFVAHKKKRRKYLNSKLCNQLIVETLIVKVRSQDVIFGLSVSKEGCETAWKWLQVDLSLLNTLIFTFDNVLWF
ncbi:Aminopeptidase M1 [Bienertia sinuspersici]